MSHRKIAVVVGILFFVQMVTYLLGDLSVQAFLDGRTTGPPTLGVLLTLSSGLAVVGIGLLMYQVLKHVDRRLAVWYPVLRIVEFAVSATLSVYLLAQLEVVANNHLWVYIPTGVGGLVLTHLLYVSVLVPRPIAVLGFVGYGCLLLGVPLTLLGVLDMGTGRGLALLLPGAMFELVVYPIWLIARGFHASSPAVASRSSSVLVHQLKDINQSAASSPFRR